MPVDYQFEKRSPQCSRCSKQFEVGEEYHSALTVEQIEAPPEPQPEPQPEAAAPAEAAPAVPAVENSEGALPFRRVDLCAGCWSAEESGEYFSFWKSVVPDEAEKQKPLAKQIDAETIYDMFRRLEGHADPGQQKFRFILALMLMRKKRLKFTGVVDSPHGEHLVLDDRDEGVTHKVLDPGLAEDEVDSLRGQIDRLLGGSGEDEDADENAAADPSTVASEGAGA